MELVEGEAITSYCDKQGLAIQARLLLFDKVCAAVQHAHQKGIIHRDLKPNNVLVTVVDGGPVPKVIDFGIAKAIEAPLTERTLFTEHGQLIGTLEYMSPEQAAGSPDLDTRTDVYSLGALLYELITGSPPFESEQLRSSAYVEIQRIIREQEPARPSARLATLAPLPTVVAHRSTAPGKLAKLVRGDLDWIVMKALEKDRRRRYDSASNLALDIGRFLASEPVVAAPPSAGYRLRKFARRHRWGVRAGAVVALSLLAGFIGTVTFAVRESRQRSLTESTARRTAEVADFQARIFRDLDAAEMGRHIQEAFREQVRASLARRLVGPYPDWRPMSAEEVEAALNAFDERARAAQPVDIARRIMHEDVLRRAAEVARSEFADQPAVLAQVLESIGSTYSSLGMFEEARALLTPALELRRGIADGDELVSAATMAHLGEAERAVGLLHEAETNHREALAIRRRVLGSEHLDTARSLGELAGVLQDSGSLVEAERLRRDALLVQQRLAGDEDPRTITAMHDLATVLHARGENDQAEGVYRRVLARRRTALGEADVQTAAVKNDLGLLLREQGDLEAAEPLLREALAAERAELGDESETVAATMRNLALVLDDRGDAGGAQSLRLDALALARDHFGAQHPSVALALNDLGVAKVRAGDARAGEALLREALAINQHVEPGPSRSTAMVLHHLAEALWQQDAVDEAEALALESVETYRAHPDWDPTEFDHALYVLALLRAHVGRQDEAVALLSEALELHRASMGADSRAFARQLESAANGMADVGDLERGETLMREALAISRARGDDRACARILHHLASLLPDSSEEQERLVLEALTLYRAHPDWDPREHMCAATALSGLYLTQGRTSLAVDALKESLVAERRFAKPGTIELENALERVGHALVRLEAVAEAVPLFREAVQVSRQMHPEPFFRTAWLQLDLGNLLARLGQLDEAEQTLLEAVDVSRAHPEWEPSTPSVFAAMLSSLASVHLSRGAPDRAEPLLQECLAIRARASADDDRNAHLASTTRSALGAAFARQGRFAEAERLLLESCEALLQDARRPEPRPRNSSEHARDALRRIVELYDAWHAAEPHAGYEARAAAWRAKLAADEVAVQAR
jgi:tetratricopeptide (TPR) repeat protein